MPLEDDPEISFDAGLVLEILLAAIYILVSYYYAFRAYRKHITQTTRAGFNTSINVTFFALFSTWATGNLIYQAVSFAMGSDSNYYIKQILTLTYFTTYLIFVMAVHYRYDPPIQLTLVAFELFTQGSKIIHWLSTQ